MDDANGVPQNGTQPAEPTSRRKAAPAPAVPATIGAELQQAREAQGLSLDDVAQRTKVRPGILRSIELDDHEHLPALTYSLGFVKAYARTVGLDPLDAAERYRRESQKGDPIPTMVDLQPLEAKRLPSAKVVTLSVAALLLLLGGFWAWGAGWLTPTPPGPPQASADAVQTAPPPPPGAVELAPPPPPANPGGPVVLTAREEVWLRISDGSENFFMGTLANGQVLTLPAGRSWQLRTGRAGALDVTVGGTAVPALGGPAEQVRNLSLAPADLLARTSAPQGLAPTVVLPTARPAAATAAPAG